MSIPISIGIRAVAVPFVAIITALILNAKFQIDHRKEYFGRKGASRLTVKAVIAFSSVLVITVYLLIVFGITLN